MNGRDLADVIIVGLPKMEGGVLGPRTVEGVLQARRLAAPRLRLSALPEAIPRRFVRALLLEQLEPTLNHHGLGERPHPRTCWPGGGAHRVGPVGAAGPGPAGRSTCLIR